MDLRDEFKDKRHNDLDVKILVDKNTIDLDVDTYDTYYGESSISLDAIELYKFLKEYFKGTRYE